MEASKYPTPLHVLKARLAASGYYTPKMLAIMEAIGGPGSAYPGIRTIFAAPLNTITPSVLPGSLDTGLAPVTSATPFSDVPDDKHIMGTHRMALDPAHCQRSRYPAAQRSSNPPLGPEDPVYSIAPPCARRGRSMS